MSDKDLNKCGCGCGDHEGENTCGCGEHNHEDHSCGCGCGEHSHDDHECGCGCGDHEYETFVVDLEDEDGNIVSCEVIDAFEYNELEYVLVQNPQDGSVYLFRSEGEEGSLAVPDDEEFQAVTKYYEEQLSE